jgi:glycosyltransferase involved in cell wall biosynthesis
MASPKVIIVSGDPVPPLDVPVSGAALRAWGLGEGLKSRGFDVHYALRRRGNQPRLILPDCMSWFKDESLVEDLLQLKPDIVLFQHWPLLLFLPEEPPFPVAVDLHGPLLLEMAYQERPDYDYFLGKKVEALARGDFFTCAGYRQQHYFRAWLIAAGFDVKDGKPHVIPISLSPEHPARGKSSEMDFVFGGHFLPWQDPSMALMELVETLERNQKGRLLLFGGGHGSGEIPPGVYGELVQRLAASPRVRIMGMVSRRELLEHYAESAVAVDLMSRNPERELAFTTRTVEYLWCGLAVIYHDYADLSEDIREYDAGWVISPDDRPGLRQVYQDILDKPAMVEVKRKAAQRLVAERFDWSRTIEPLACFCANPRRLIRPSKLVRAITSGKILDLPVHASPEMSAGARSLALLASRLELCERDLEIARHEITQLRALRRRLDGFPPYRFYRWCKKRLVERGVR